MAIYLYRLGLWAARKRKQVLLGGLAVMILTIALGLGMGTSFSGEMTIPGTKSEQALKVLKEAFPALPGTDNGTIQIVMKAPNNDTLETAAVQSTVKRVLDAIGKDPAVAMVASPYDAGTMSATKQIGYAVITYKTIPVDVTEASKDLVLQQVNQLRGIGVQTELGGTVAYSELEVGGLSEAVGIIVAYLILAITFASFLVAGLPILTAIIGLAIGLMCVIIGSHFITMSSFSLTLAVMLGLAVGIDYGLFIISRFRKNLREGKGVEEAIALSNATAGSAVVFAGLTVIIALAGLAVTQIPFITMMGVAAAFTVLVAVLVSIIIVPAVLGMVGAKILPKKLRTAPVTKQNRTPVSDSSRWGRVVTKYPLPMAIVGIALLAFISLPALHLQTGLPDNGSKSKDTTERRAYDLLAEAFGPGSNGPLVIVARAEGKNDAQAAIGEATANLKSLPNVVNVSEPMMSPNGQVALLTMIPGTDPKDAKTTALVHAIRAHSKETEQQNQVELLVTGSTAVNIDITDKLNGALPRFAILIVGLAIILLAMVFRSILIPVKAVLGYLLTLTATLGFIVFIIQDGNLIDLFHIPQSGPVLNFLPILVAGILFGLAMDYEVFLVSGMREAYIHSGDARQAVRAGLKSSGSVVTAAGLIMISVFASFIFAEDTMIKSMGLALAFGILFDAFVVRLTIVPAVMTLMGRSAWYVPKWLDRILPNIDVEGESVMKQLEKGKH